MTNILKPHVETKQREKGARKPETTWPRILRGHLRKLVVSKREAYANALEHALHLIVKESVSANPKLWIKVLESKKSFKPSKQGLEEAGYIPDCKFRMYKNLFTPLEWEEITKQRVLEKEEALNRDVNTLKNVDDVLRYLSNLKSLRDMIKQDPFIQGCIAIRHRRLGV
jgi:hypothetical protein